MTNAPTGSATTMRNSPVSFAATPLETEARDGWQVVLAYEGEGGQGPWLVDLSHMRRWDFQDGGLEGRRPMGLAPPKRIGGVAVNGGLAISRMNRTQVAIWRLGDVQRTATDPAGGHATDLGATAPGLTETTDGHCMLAFVGAGVPAVMEHLTPLDLFRPDRARPFLTQGPVLRVACQIVTFADDLVVMTLARGYGETFAAATLASGGLEGLAPAGERTFARAFAQVMR